MVMLYMGQDVSRYWNSYRHNVIKSTPSKFGQATFSKRCYYSLDIDCQGRRTGTTIIRTDIADGTVILHHLQKYEPYLICNLPENRLFEYRKVP